jgi:general secretion pathway protein L
MRIVLLAHAPDAPSLSLVIADGRVVERADLFSDPEQPPEPLPCTLVVPGAEALARWLPLNVRTEAQAGPAAALLLEEQLATPRERIQVALGAPEPDAPRLAVVADREALDGWLERATALGVFPDVVLPDHLTLPAVWEGDVVAVRFGDTYAVRGERLALSCEADLLPLVLGDRAWREIVEPSEIEMILVAAAAAPVVNLLQPTASVAAPPSTWRQLRAAAVLLGLLLLSPLALSVVNTVRLDAATREIERRTEARARASLPSTERVVDADVQLRARIERLRSSDQFPAAAAALFTALQQSGGVDLEALSFEPDRPLRATLSYATPDQLELFRTAARQAGFEAQVAGGSILNGRTVSDVTLSRPS